MEIGSVSHLPFRPVLQFDILSFGAKFRRTNQSIVFSSYMLFQAQFLAFVPGPRFFTTTGSFLLKDVFFFMLQPTFVC